jgi:hypothetical protein
VPVAALAAIGCFAAHEVDPVAGAEGAYLARLAAAVLVAVAALAPAPAAELGLGAALATAAAWVLPGGPGRGAVVLALLLGALAVASARRLMRTPAAGNHLGAKIAGRPEQSGGERQAGPRRRVRGAPLATAIALCFGWQVLLRGELLFAPGRAMRPWVALVVLPVVAGAALALLWIRRGALPALAAAAVAVVLAPGWTVATTLALVALAGGDSLAPSGRPDGAGATGVAAPETGATAPPPAGLTAPTVGTTASAIGVTAPAAGMGAPAEGATAPAPGITAPAAGLKPPAAGLTAPVPQRTARPPATTDVSERVLIHGGPWPMRMVMALRRRPLVTRVAGAAALLLPVAWEPRSGWAAALAGLALWRPGLAAAAALPLAVVVRGAALAGWTLPGALAAHASWREGELALAWLVILVPAALLALRQRRSGALVGTAALLAFAAPWLPDRSALAAPLALAALALPAMGAAAGIGALWSAAVLLGTALLAAYPWLRQDPLGDAAALLGMAPGPGLAAAIGGAALLLGLGVDLALRRAAAAAGGAGAPGLGPLAAPGQAPGQPGGRDAAAPASAQVAGDDSRDSLALTPAAAGRSAQAAAARSEQAAGGRSAQAAAGGSAHAAAWAVGAVLFAALAGPRLASPGTALIAAGDTVLLDSSHASWQADLGPRRSRTLVVESSMINAAGLAGGTPVARVRLLGTGAAPLELLLRAGEDTGEWAARRPDLAAIARRPAPHPWLAWVAGDFFGQRYRARLPLPRTVSFARLRIELAAGLPPATGLALHQVEVEP